MRCTRCDGLAVPQAVGRTPDGRLVFGWCLACMEDAGCLDVEVARRGRGLNPFRRHRPAAPPRPGHPDAPPDGRRRLASAFALVLALWGVVLILGGLVVLSRPVTGPVSPLGNGSPSLLLVAGCVVTALGLGLWAWTSGRSFLGSRLGLRVVQSGAFLAALATLAAGIVAPSPKRGPLIIAVTTFALAVSVALRRAELRRLARSPRRGPD